MRKRLSLPEALLWRRIRPREFPEAHIRRQHPFGAYTLDFYCDEAKLCIEVDGEGHGFGNAPSMDARRDAYLAEHGVRVLRLSARLVLSDMDSAIGTIRLALSERPHPPLRGPPSPAGKDF